MSQIETIKNVLEELEIVKNLHPINIDEVLTRCMVRLSSLLILRGGFVNVYEDIDGRFISNSEYETYEDAYQHHDDFPSYIETIEIVRHER